MPTAELIRLVKELGAPYGFERSVKITPGTLADDRCLISVGRAALGTDPAGCLLRIGHALDMPQSLANDLPISLQRADIVHFGYEGVSGRDVYKIYFEYAAQVRRAMAEPSHGPVLVHLAYKWAPSAADECVVTRYTWVPYRTRHALEAKLRELVPVEDAPYALRCTLNLVSRIAAFADAGELLLMEVEEPGNPRRSCDLNVYDADLRMHQIADLLDAALRDFGVPQARAQSVLELIGDRALGHLSAGVGRDGQEFLTVYFGVEAH